MNVVEHTPREILELIRQVALEIYRAKDDPPYSRQNNSLLTATMCARIVERLPRAAGEVAFHIGVDSHGQRVSGEFLLDGMVGRQLDIKDPVNAVSRAKILAQLHWAVEVEADSSLPEFAKDFAKLLLINSSKCLYLNGLQQRQGWEQYIDRRLSIAAPLVLEFSAATQFYVGFFPSPNAGLWYEILDEGSLLERLQLFIFDRRAELFSAVT